MAFISRGQLEQRLAPWIGATTGDRLGLVLLATIYIKVFFTFSPFKRSGGNAALEGGSTINQLYWLGIPAFACFVIWRNWGTAMVLLRRTWVYFLPMAWFAIALLWSPDFDVTLRRSILIFLMAGVAFGVAAARPSPADFLNTSAMVIGFILLLSVISVVVVPHLARPGGAFLGIYEQKNSAGYVAGLTFVFWVFFMLSSLRFEVKILAFFGCLVWLFFLVGTLSKTSLGLGLLIPIIATSLYYVLRLDLQWRVMAYVAGTVFIGIVIWIILFIDWTIEDVGVLVFEDLTFTNRTQVWKYVIMSIEERPLVGHGYGAFWRTGDGNRLDVEQRVGWAAQASSSHNGYLNLWLETGLIGLLLSFTVIVVVIRGTLDLMARPGQPRLDRWVYATLLAVALFILLRDMMESSIYLAHTSTTMLFFLVAYLVAAWRWECDQLSGYWEPEMGKGPLSAIRLQNPGLRPTSIQTLHVRDG